MNAAENETEAQTELFQPRESRLEARAGSECVALLTTGDGSGARGRDWDWNRRVGAGVGAARAGQGQARD